MTGVSEQIVADPLLHSCATQRMGPPAFTVVHMLLFSHGVVVVAMIGAPPFEGM
jgi:hypothetical protein